MKINILTAVLPIACVLCFSNSIAATPKPGQPIASVQLPPPPPPPHPPLPHIRNPFRHRPHHYRAHHRLTIHLPPHPRGPGGPPPPPPRP